MATLLTYIEARRLIDMLKKTVQKNIEFPSGKGGIIFDVIGAKRTDEFIINIDRKGIAAEKCTYQSRIKQNNQVLLRLDIDPTGKHTNPGPDGELIRGNHVHIYTEEYGIKYAIPFDINDRNLYDLCFEFFQKFNIIEPPEVVSQLTIL